MARYFVEKETLIALVRALTLVIKRKVSTEFLYQRVFTDAFGWTIHGDEGDFFTKFRVAFKGEPDKSGTEVGGAINVSYL